MKNYHDGTGDTATELPEYRKEAVRRAFDKVLKAREEHKAVAKMHNAALIGDFASGLMNVIARRKGSRFSLPVDASAKSAPYFLQSSERLKEAERDYKGIIAKEILFSPRNGDKQNEIPAPTYIPPITNTTGKFNLPKPEGSWNKVLAKWRREKMMTPEWYVKKIF